MTAASQTYAGLRVLELATTIAGPFCSMILADLGADVVKIERPHKGDDARAMPPHWHGESTVFLAVNRNKRSVVLDVKTRVGREAFLRLAADADVVVQSFRPGTAERLGVGYDDLLERNPAIVYCQVSAFGAAGSAAGLPGYDPLIQAFTGIMSMTGHAGGPPVRVAPSLIDLSTGMWAAMGTMAALTRRATTGEPQHVEATLVDSGYMLLCHQIASLLATGIVPAPEGSGSPITAPYEAFRSADGWVMIAAGNDDQFARLCAALGAEQLVGDARFETPVTRVANRPELHAQLERCTERMPSETLIERMRAAGVPISPINTLRDAVDHPVAAERAVLVAPLDATRLPGLRLVRLPCDDARPPALRHPPKLGEHSEQVLAEAGFTADEIECLLADDRGGIASETPAR
jgi:crotonobetainyl-CoA:carnitine CoA-transferase CaiB-like acyl-CoA transferase